MRSFGCRAKSLAVFSIAFALVVSTHAGRARAADTRTADVLIQAGHEGRPDCNREVPSLCHNTGAVGEIDWTPIVADEATRTLRAAGITVLREPAFLSGQYNVTDAVFIHFDGSTRPCSSGASVGYPHRARSAAAAAAWKQLYKAAFPFGFEPDNFTKTEAGYYGFKRVEHIKDAALLIEGGEISCPQQRAWLAHHLKFEGDLIAHFVSMRIGKGNVPLPGAP